MIRLITEADVARNLMFNRYRRHFVLPRYTPDGWWESDVFEVTISGYFREYEIKLTLADFRADAEKRTGARPGRPGHSLLSPRTPLSMVDQLETKHQRLARGDIDGPSQFWFVAPAGLIPVDQIPPWAGLIEVRERPGWKPMQLLEQEVRPAPRLHRQKMDDRRLEHARSVIYYRLHQLMSEMEGLPQVYYKLDGEAE